MKPVSVSELDRLLGSKAMELLPKYEEIPDEFKGFRGVWSDLTERWFFEGINGEILREKSGIDREAALRHLDACMRSFAPKHEHKIAGVAYLMSQWFELVEAPTRSKVAS